MVQMLKHALQKGTPMWLWKLSYRVKSRGRGRRGGGVESRGRGRRGGGARGFVSLEPAGCGHFQAGQRRTWKYSTRGLVCLDVRDPPHTRRISRRANLGQHPVAPDVAQRAAREAIFVPQHACLGEGAGGVERSGRGLEGMPSRRAQCTFDGSKGARELRRLGARASRRCLTPLGAQ